MDGWMDGWMDIISTPEEVLKHQQESLIYPGIKQEFHHIHWNKKLMELRWFVELCI